MSKLTWGVRNCFIPRDGFVMGTIDYAGLELACTAHQLYVATGRHNMLDLFNSGDTPVDPHSIFGAKLKSTKDRRTVTYEEFLANKKEKGYKEFRQFAKPINLGFPGGIGYDQMRVILAGQGIFPKLQILNKSISEENLKPQRKKFRQMGHPVRIRQVALNEFQLVYDELVDIKDQMFQIYPDLKQFLQEEHYSYIMRDDNNKVIQKKVKNDFGIDELEPMYQFMIPGFERQYSTYTQFCNGFLMQSPAAIGAKSATCKVIEKYAENADVNILAFIHDEIIFEVKEGSDMYEITKDIAEIMIDEMQKIVAYSRITVEMSLMRYWDKEVNFWTEQMWKQGRKLLDNDL